MKLITHTALTCAHVSVKTTVPMMTIYPGRNEIRFNKFALAAMKIGGSGIRTSIIFHQDANSPGDWYLQPTNLGEGFFLRKERENRIFRNSKLISTFLKSINYTGIKLIRIPVAAFPIKEKEVELYALLTSSVKK